MKTSSIKWTQYLGLGLTLAAFAWLLPCRASASMVFDYDLYTISPDALPQNPPWTSSGAGTKSVSDPSNVLTMVDNNGSNYGPYFGNSAALTISSTTEYEMRSRVRIISDNLTTSFFLYYQDIYDGTRYLAVCMELDNSTGETRFFLGNTSGTVLAGTSAVEEPGSDFFQVDVKKTGMTGTAADTVTVLVDGTPIITTSYTNLSLYAFTGLDWGEGSTPATGTAELTGASFGIGTAAPALLPEPSSVGLIALGWLLVQARRQRS